MSWFHTMSIGKIIVEGSMLVPTIYLATDSLLNDDGSGHKSNQKLGGYSQDIHVLQLHQWAYLAR